LVSGLSTQLVIVGIVIWRRHLPIWMTSGTFVPEGTSLRVNVPSAAVLVVTSGEPV
jgi:hypothetical protein